MKIYPKPICQDCGKECEIWEEVKIEVDLYEVWCYCDECDVETFHPIIEEE